MIIMWLISGIDPRWSRGFNSEDPFPEMWDWIDACEATFGDRPSDLVFSDV